MMDFENFRTTFIDHRLKKEASLIDLFTAYGMLHAYSLLLQTDRPEEASAASDLRDKIYDIASAQYLKEIQS